MFKKDFLIISSMVMLILAGSILIQYSTELGPWTMVDTVDYFDVARNLSSGNGLVLTRPSGLTKPMTIHPPLYSIVLAPAVLLHLDLLHFVRGLNLLLFAAMILIVCWGTYRFTSSALLSIGLGLWVVTNRAILRNFTAALSEPLFLTVGVSSLYLIHEYIRKNKRWLMFASAILAGLALFTRYSGVAFLVTGFFTILIWQKTDWNAKLKDLASYAISASIPTLLWLGYLRIYFSGNSPGRYEWITNIWQTMIPFRLTFVEGLWEWLGLRLLLSTQDYNAQLSIFAFLFIAMGLAAILAIRVSKQEKNAQLFESSLFWGSAWAIFTIASTAILLFSYIFVASPKPWLDERLYSPIQIGMVFTIILVVHFCESNLIRGTFRHIPTLAIMVLLIIANTPGMVARAQTLHKIGEGYTSSYWKNSTVVSALQDIPPDKMIISNDPGAILFFTGRPSLDLIPIIDRTEKNVIPEILQENGMVLVLFEQKFISQLKYIYGDESEQYINRLDTALQVKFKGNNGTIYYPP